MSKKYDFSAFDNPTPEKKDYDFSAFEKRETAAIPEETLPEQTEPEGAIDWNQKISPFETLMNSGAQAITGSFADEIEAGVKNPMGGAKSLLGLLGMDNSGDKDVQAYVEDRDNLRARYDETAAANPITNVIGTIGGSLIPGAAISKLIGPAGKLASGVVGPLNKATTLQKMGQAAKVGGVGGALYGAGGSEADLAKGEVGDLALDTAGSGLVGAGLGVGIEGGIGLGKSAVGGLSSVGKFFSKLKSVERFKDAKALGEEGVELTTTESLKAAGDDLTPKVEELATLLLGARKKAGTLYGVADDILNASNKTYNVEEKIALVKAGINELRKSRDSAAKAEIKILQEVLDNFEKGMPTDVQFSPLVPRTLPDTSGARQKLQDEAVRAEEAARQLGQKLTTKIVESTDDQGRKLVTLVKTSDEAIGSGEALVPVPKAEGVDDLVEEAADPFFKSWNTNGPKELEKANGLAATLNSKAKHNNTGKVYKVFDDKEHGVIHVMELNADDALAQKAGKLTEFPTAPPKAPPAPEGPPEFELMPDDGMFKSSATAKTIIEPPAPQGAFTPTQPQSVMTPPVDFKKSNTQDVRDLISTFNRLSGAKTGNPELKTDIGINSLKRAAGGLKAQLKDTPEYAEANRLWAAQKQAFQELGINVDNPEQVFMKSAKTGEKVLIPAVRAKLVNDLRRLATDTSASINSKTKLENTLKLVAEIAPEEVEKLRPALEKASKRLDLAQIAQKAKPGSQTSIYEAAPVWIGNRIGLTMRKFTKSQSPEEFTKLGTTLEAQGGDKARVGKIIKELATKDDLARNATMFSLAQQPWARKVLDGIFDREDKDETK